MKKLLIIFLVLLIILVLPFFLVGDRIEELFAGDGALQWLRSTGGYAWLAAIGLLIADLLLPIPTTAVMAALGIIYGPFWGGLAAVAGSLSSGLIGYGLCRRFGRPLALHFAGDKALDQGEKLFARMGGWMVALSRWLPVLSEVIACIAGLARMPFGPFLGALLCGTLPLGFVFAVIGHLGEERPILTLVLSALLPFLLWAVVRPFMRSKAVNA